MKIFILKIKDGLTLATHPCFNPYAHAAGYTICAADEDAAREKAYRHTGDEVGEGDWWLDPAVTSCDVVGVSVGPVEVLLVDVDEARG